MTAMPSVSPLRTCCVCWVAAGGGVPGVGLPVRADGTGHQYLVADLQREILHLSTTLSVQVASIFAGSLALGRLAVVSCCVCALVLGAGCCVMAMAALVLVVLPLAAKVQARPDQNLVECACRSLRFPADGLLMAPIYPTINSVVLSALPKTRHAAMTGLIVVFSALGGTTGSLITGQLFAHFDGSRAFYLPLVPMAMLLVSLTLLNRSAHTPDTAAAGGRTRMIDRMLSVPCACAARRHPPGGRRPASAGPLMPALAKESAPAPLQFRITEGRISMRSISRPGGCAPAAELGHAPRVLVAFPAGNSGVGVWFEGAQNRSPGRSAR